MQEVKVPCMQTLISRFIGQNMLSIKLQQGYCMISFCVEENDETKHPRI